MEKFYVNFRGFVTIKADSAEEAEKKFWDWISSVDYRDDCYDDEWFIDLIEDESEED
jgi:hypothetical protein